MAALGVVATPDEGSAVPAFARQTGQACAACHFQYFPKLNAYGRSFKLGGFTEASTALIEDEGLSIPAVMPVSLVTKVRYEYTTPKSSSGEKKGTDRGEWQIPDELTLFLGGRISDIVGWTMEYPPGGNGWGRGSIVFSVPMGDARAGLSIFSTDGHGPAQGMELLNTGVLRGGRTMEMRKETIIAQKLGLGGPAAGIALFAGSQLWFANVSLWGPADLNNVEVIDAGFDLALYYRLAITPSFGDWDTAIGVFGASGKAKCVACMGEDATTVTELKTEFFGVDAQVQGEFSGMTLEVQAMYMSNPADAYMPDGTTGKKQEGFSAVASLGFNPSTGVMLGGSSYSNKTSSGKDVTATSVGFWYSIAQNLRLQPEYAFYSGDGRSKDSKLLVMLFGGF
jgi:hypothetical protein